MCDSYTINLSDYFLKELPFDSVNELDILKRFGYEKIASGYQFNPSQFSREFLGYVSLRMLRNQELVLYNRAKGIYELDSEPILQRLIKYCMDLLGDLWSPRDADTALKAIRHDTTTIVNQFGSGDYIVLRDEVLDLTNFTFHPHSPDYFSTVWLPFNYDSSCPTPVFEKYLDDITCGDGELKLLLQEITGYCLSSSTAAEKGFFLVGNGCNGKSVYTRLLQLLVGDGNFSSTSLSALNGNFGLAALINSNVNISAENTCDRINSETFKAVVSGDVVEVNRKYKDALSVKLSTKLVMVFNSLPESNDLSYGFFRKIIIVPFKLSLDRNKVDVELLEKMKEELPGIFCWAIEGLKRLRSNKFLFSSCKASESALQDYKKQLNPVASFFENYFAFEPGGCVRKSMIYEVYERTCQGNGVDPLSRQKFWKLLNAFFAENRISLHTKRVKGYDYIDGIAEANTSNTNTKKGK